MSLAGLVKIVEVSPRDGLQNERLVLPTGVKLEFIDMLCKAGVGTLEITSCVPPRLVPQLADHSRVIAGVEVHPDVLYTVLVPNMKGFEHALAAGAQGISVIASASEHFSQKNANCSVEEGLHRCREILRMCSRHELPARGYISCSLGCPFTGAIQPGVVADVAGKLLASGCSEIVLSDTIGVGTPGQVELLLDEVAELVPMERLAIHFHDTYGQALVNIYTAIKRGVRTVDSSVAGLGGCPFAPGAAGNVATEELVYMLHGMNIVTGIDLSRLVSAGDYISDVLGRPRGSRMALALGNKG